MILNEGIPMTMNVEPSGTSRNSGGMFGDGGAWWLILFVILFCGWGGNGGLLGGNRSGGAVEGYTLTSDFANIERKLDGITNGLSDGFYAMNTGMLNGFAGVTQAINNGFMNAELSRCNQQAALMQQLFAMQMQQQQCCCEQRADAAQTRYDLATQGCDTRNLIQGTTRDLIEAMNSGFRSLDQRLTAQELAAKDAKIAEQNQQLFAAQLAASQAAQNDTLKSYVSGQFAYYNPRPEPAYIVQNPNCCRQYSGCGCGCN